MTRVLAALVLIAVVITTIWMLPPWATIGLAVLAAALAAFELAGLAAGVRAGASGVFGFGLAASAALFCFAFAVLPPDGIPDTVFVGLMLAMVVLGAVLLAMGPPTRATTTWAIALMAGVYVGLPLGALGKVQMVHGPAVLTVLLALVAVSDSAQYYAGRAFGRRKLAPSVSPAKTVEGALGGLVAAGLVGAFLGSRWIPGVTVFIGTTLGLVLGAVGMVGDLFESLLKRSAGVKDSSSLIPGHGGVLDRIDSWLFVAPVYYAFLRYLA